MPAHAADSAPITRYHVKVDLTEEGEAKVTIDMTMDFAEVEGRGPYILLPTRQDDGQNKHEQFVFEYDDIEVSSSTGARTDLQKEHETGVLSLRIGSANIVNHSPQQYTISYTLTGVVASNHPKSGLDEFSWNVIGTQWKSSFEDIAVTITGPASVSKSDCFYGPTYGDSCETSASGSTATYALNSLPAQTGMQVVAGFPAGTFGGVQQTKAPREVSVLEQISRGEVFKLDGATGTATGAGLIAAVLGVLAIRRRHARDKVYLGLTPGLTPAPGEEAPVRFASGKAPVTVQFHPPKGATPGEIGTLIDATADNIDVSATIVDLAVRKFIRIKSEGSKFTLIALDPPPGDELTAYESRLLTDIFRGEKQRTSDELSKAKYARVLPNARDGLYSAVVSKRWFISHPTWAMTTPIVGGLLIMLLGVLVALAAGLAAGWGLIGLPIVAFGLGLIIISGHFRRRTALGSAMLAQAKGFELYLATAEKETLQLEEDQDIFSRYLPYAMVFGVAARWSKLFATLGEEGVYRADTSWYSGTDLVQGVSFARAMSNLTHSMSSTMQAARYDGISSSTGSSSGFSGFSGGGGFGGGGGGSW